MGFIINLSFFIIALIVSFIVVRIGAIAFQLTGLEWSIAKFQALSCFSGTGFTTSEAELIVSNPQRRKIASILMVLGNLGLVALIATFANSLRPPAAIAKLKLPFMDLFIPARFIPFINLIILLLITFVIFKILTNSIIVRKVTQFLKAHIKKKKILKPELLAHYYPVAKGYGVAQIELCGKSPYADKPISKSGIKELDLTILAIEKEGDIILKPPDDLKLTVKDKITCFGSLEHIKDVICE